MIWTKNCFSITCVVISVTFALIALLLACVGISTPNWQNSIAFIDGRQNIFSTANFFYACRSNPDGTLIGCTYRSSDKNINQYYPIDARWNQTEWNQHLDNAAGLCIVGIIFIGFGLVTTFLMIITDLPIWVYLLGPVGLFLACLFMLAGMAEGAYVLYYNGYAANLYQTAHLMTIFSFLISCIEAGRAFQFLDAKDIDIPLTKP